VARIVKACVQCHCIVVCVVAVGSCCAFGTITWLVITHNVPAVEFELMFTWQRLATMAASCASLRSDSQ
jgi:hypothetical protein